jgi:hypothetical protein
MMSIIGKGILAIIEKELINHAPEMQQALIEELTKLSAMLADFLIKKAEGDKTAPNE